MTNPMTEFQRLLNKCFTGEIYDIVCPECYKIIEDIKQLPMEGNVTFDKPLDAIAFDLYKDENLYYILQIYNDIIDPLQITNTIISYPSKTDVLDLISRYNND